MSEAKLEVKVREWCKKNGWKRKKMSSPGTRGTLDDYFIKDGRHVWIEMMWLENTPTMIQWDEIDDMREHGGEAYWCNELTQVIAVLNEGSPWGLLNLDGYAGLPPQHKWMM